MVLRSIIRKRHEVFLQKKKNPPPPKQPNQQNQQNNQNQQQQNQQNQQREEQSRNSLYEERYGFDDEKDEKSIETNVEEEGEDKREFMINNVVFKVQYEYIYILLLLVI